jgi:hypothetical protein
MTNIWNHKLIGKFYYQDKRNQEIKRERKKYYIKKVA